MTDDGKQGPTPKEIVDDTVSWDEGDPPEWITRFSDLLDRELATRTSRLIPSFNEPELPSFRMIVEGRTAAEGERKILAKAMEVFEDDNPSNYEIPKTYALAFRSADGLVYGEMQVFYHPGLAALRGKLHRAESQESHRVTDVELPDDNNS